MTTPAQSEANRQAAADLVTIAETIRMMSPRHGGNVTEIHDLEPFAETVKAIGLMLQAVMRDDYEEVMGQAMLIASLAEDGLQFSAQQTYERIEDGRLTPWSTMIEEDR